MKKIIFYLSILLLILVNNRINAQNIYLKINNDTHQNHNLYIFENAKLMEIFVNDTIKSLEKYGYIDIQHNLAINDTIYTLHINKNDKLNFIRFKNSESKNKDIALLGLEKNIINFEDLDTTLKQLLVKLEDKGYGTTEIQLVNHKINSDTLEVDLKIINPDKRIINKIHIVGYDKFPNGIKKQIEKNIVGKVLTNKNLEKINSDLNNLSFINQTKPIELLLEREKTNLYIYVEKNKTNKFDGFIGFGTNETGKLNLD